MKWLMAIVVTVVCAAAVTAPLSRAGQDAKAATTVAGKWHFVLNTEGGDRDIDANFEQDGKKVTGKFGKDDVKGTFEDGKLKLEFLLNSEEAGPGTMKITAKLARIRLRAIGNFKVIAGRLRRRGCRRVGWARSITVAPPTSGVCSLKPESFATRASAGRHLLRAFRR